MGSVLSLSSSPPAGAQRAPTNCSPPPAGAADCAAQRAAEAVLCSPSHSVKFGLSPTPPRRSAPGRQSRRPKGRNNSGTSTAPILSGSGSALPGWAERPSTQAQRFEEPQKHAPFCGVCFRPQPAENEDGAQAEYFGPPHPRAAGRPLTRGLSYSLAAQNITKSTAQLTAQIPAQNSAQRGAKTVFGFRARRTSKAQSRTQFSAPCPPHCGSAIAPPLPLGT